MIIKIPKNSDNFLTNEELYVVSLFCENPIQNISSQVLKEKFGNRYKRIIDTLVYLGIISQSSQYIPSIKSRTYTLQEQVDCWVDYEIPDSIFRKKRNFNKSLQTQTQDLNRATFRNDIWAHLRATNADVNKFAAVNRIIKGQATIGQDTFSSREYGPHTTLSNRDLRFMQVDGQPVVILDLSASIMVCLFSALVKARILDQEMLKFRRYLELGFWDCFPNSDRNKIKKDAITQLNVDIKSYMGIVNNPDTALGQIAQEFPKIFLKIIPQLKRKHGDNIISKMFMNQETAFFSKLIKEIQRRGKWTIRHHDSVVIKKEDTEQIKKVLLDVALCILKVNAKYAVNEITDDQTKTAKENILELQRHYLESERNNRQSNALQGTFGGLTQHYQPITRFGLMIDRFNLYNRSD